MGILVNTAIGELGAVGIMKLVSRWVPAFTTIQFAGRLAWPAAAAGGVWLIAKPWGDTEIQNSWSAWRTASQQLQDMRFNDWGEKVKAIKAAWPDGEDSQAFDTFIKTVRVEMAQTEQAMGKIADAVQTCQTQIHEIMNTVGFVADLLLASIIAAELAEAFFPSSAIAEAMKNATAAVLMGVTAASVGAVVAAVIYNLGNISALLSSDTVFPHPQPNRSGASFDSNTDFKDIRVQNAQDKGWTYY
jgi:hypothetical protein